MPRLLVAHHTPSPATQALLEAVLDGARTDAIEGVEVDVQPALTCPEIAVLDADGYLLGTPANIGYMSGALKHLFDRIYYPALSATGRRPYGLWVHGNDDTAGAVRSVTTITTALSWQVAADPVTVVGAPGRDELDACWNLGATLAATVAGVT